MDAETLNLEDLDGFGNLFSGPKQVTEMGAQGFHRWWYPKMHGLKWKLPLKWMIWVYPHFRKPPYDAAAFFLVKPPTAAHDWRQCCLPQPFFPWKLADHCFGDAWLDHHFPSVSMILIISRRSPLDPLVQWGIIHLEGHLLMSL